MGRPETLTAHTRAVIRALAQIQRRWPHLAELCVSPRLWHRLFWACCIHDFGKAAAPFQQMLKGNVKSYEHRHEVLSLAFLLCVAERDQPDFSWIAAAVASHHKSAAEILQDRYSVGVEREHLQRQLDVAAATISADVYRALTEWLRAEAYSYALELGLREVSPLRAEVISPGRQDAADAIYAGLVAYDHLVRSLGRLPVAHKENQAAIILRGAMTLADHLASAHAPSLAQVALPDVPALLQPNESVRVPWPHQLDAATSAGNMVLTAPTGSGKTEAALLWGRSLQQRDGWLRPLLYLLPYQASLNAMYQRLRNVLATDVALLHARSTQVLNRQMLDEGIDPKSAARRARRAADLAGLHQPAVCVATPYQLLRAAFMLPGYELQWTVLSGTALVVDEIHAYDPQRIGLFLGLIAALVRQWDIRVCVLTATLPTWLRSLVTETTDALPVSASAPVYEAFRRHQLELVEGDVGNPAILARIAADAEGGLSVLVVVNTIREAQETWRYLRRLLSPESPPLLLHSRFTGRDRGARESLVVNRLSTRTAVDRPLVLVSTQAVEVSLDLDFDTIYTQPAPLEALAQRFGRVNRTGRKGIVPVRVLTQPRDGQGIYDPRLIERTLAVLGRHDGEPVDEAALTAWLDDVYGEDLAAEWTQMVRHSRRSFERDCLDQLRAFGGDEDLADQFDKLFDGTEVLPLALEAEYIRLAEDSILSAQSLLVRLGWKTLRFNWSKVRWTSDRSVRVIDLPYDSEMGLQVNSGPTTE